MKKLLALVAASTLLILAVPAYAATRTVKVDDNVFSPRSMTVNRGDTVRFRWVGDAPHNVKRVSGPSFTNIGFKRRGAVVSRRLTRRGTLKLVCTIHAGMRQTITVR
jgi:plastocyanin